MTNSISRKDTSGPGHRRYGNSDMSLDNIQSLLPDSDLCAKQKDEKKPDIPDYGTSPDACAPSVDESCGSNMQLFAGAQDQGQAYHPSHQLENVVSCDEKRVCFRPHLNINLAILKHFSLAPIPYGCQHKMVGLPTFQRREGKD